MNKRLLMLAVLIAVIMLSVSSVSAEVIPTQSHMKYTLYIGLNDGDTGKQEVTTEQAKAKLNEVAAKYIDGYTLYEADGFWREDGEIFTEHTIVCVIVDAPEESVKNVMNEMLKALNQHSILLEVSETKSTFYSGE